MTTNGSNGAGITRFTPLDELPQFLSVEEFAAFHAIGRGTVYTMVKAKTITYKKFGRVIRIPRSQCMAMEHVRS
jgi:excisionase family DNA binding protein